METTDKKVIATITNSTETKVAGGDIITVNQNIVVNNFFEPGDTFSINTKLISQGNIDEQNLRASFESILKFGRDKDTAKFYFRNGYSRPDTEKLFLSLENIGKAKEDIVESICDVFHICTACGKNYDLADQLFPSADLLSSYTDNWDSYGKIRLEVNLSKMEYLYGNNDKAVQIGFKAKQLLPSAPISQKQKEELESTIITLLSEYDLSYIDLSVKTAESIYGKYSTEVLSKLRCASCRYIGKGYFDKAEHYLNEYYSRRDPTILKGLSAEQADKVVSTHKGIVWNRVVKIFSENRHNSIKCKAELANLLTPDEMLKLRSNPVDKSFAYFILYNISDGKHKENYKRLAKQTFKEVKVQNHCTFDLNKFKQELQNI